MRRSLVVIVLATLVGCDSDTPTRPDPSTRSDPSTRVTGITVTGDASFAALNEVHLLTATAQLLNAPPRNVTAEAEWQSSNGRVMTVSPGGEATAVGLGTAMVTARYQSISGSLEVTVNPRNPLEPLEGLYRLRVTAAAACRSLPDWARQREYDARMEQGKGTQLSLDVELQTGFWRGFAGEITETGVGFYFGTDDPYGYNGGGFCATPCGNPYFSEGIDATRRFTLEGNAKATRHGTTISGRLHGTIRAVNPTSQATIAECPGDHSFSLVRQ
jgi:hypothetical protein